MTTSDFIDPDDWFSGLPGVVVAAGALITLGPLALSLQSG